MVVEKINNQTETAKELIVKMKDAGDLKYLDQIRIFEKLANRLQGLGLARAGRAVEHNFDKTHRISSCISRSRGARRPRRA